MAEFNLVGSPEPFLHVSMKQGEAIYCESDAMVMVEQNLEVGGKLRGGIFQAFMRKFTSGESLFQQQIKAVKGAGECLLSPNLDGDMQILEVGQRQYILSDGSFVAATEHTIIKAKVQSNIGGALFGGTGGFVVMETSGQGKVCISGSGTLLELDITPEQGEVTIDNGHVTAWDASLNYNIGIPSSGGGGDSIDLDASAIMFDQNNKALDSIWFGQLQSRDGSIKHSGDNRTGLALLMLLLF